MWIIKLGGSVCQQTTLVPWLQQVARHGDGKVIIVPGGGLFADAVRAFQAMRAQQPDGHLSEAQAHALAIYAMDQTARSLVSMVPELVLVRNPLEIAERGWQHLGLVWLPSEMALNPDLWDSSGLAESWEVTSDSLSAWLASQLEAEHLLLVKSAQQLQTAHASYLLPDLQAEGILDVGMTQALSGAGFQSWVMHHHAVAAFDQGFDPEQLSGRLSYS